MVIARKYLVREHAPGCYHVMSRCVRRLHCLAVEERREWVERCLRIHAQKMAIDVLTFAVMKNHVHVVVRIRPDLVEGWSAREVVDKWLDLVPRRDGSGEILETDETLRELIATDGIWVEERRSRLCSMSWLMRLVKQKISIRMNREDQVTGCFWDERFTSILLPDERAILACMVYVDLNPFRAGECQLPENGCNTGLHIRLKNRSFYGGECRSQHHIGHYRSGVDFQAELGVLGDRWVLPLEACGDYLWHFDGGWVYDSPEWLTERWYLDVLDAAAREVRFTGSGNPKHRLDEQMAHIFDRMGI